MERCLQLAGLGRGFVSPNPMVGAVLVYNGRIIGEGFHERFGEAHAEVHCLASVASADLHLISESTLYVSLEPCAHFGKTPPCTNLILQQKVPKVIIGCPDPFPAVNGKGAQVLKDHGVEVKQGILEESCREINKRFFTFHRERRPYIILKWAQSQDAKIGMPGRQVRISNQVTQRLVHTWRHEEDAICVGSGTALADNPSLTTRHFPGKNPIRVLIDKELAVEKNSNIFKPGVKTFVFNLVKNSKEEHVETIKIMEKNFTAGVLKNLYEKNIQSLIIEGGRSTLQYFIDNECWDEARVITNNQMILPEGINAPAMKNFKLRKEEMIDNDLLQYFTPNGA